MRKITANIIYPVTSAPVKDAYLLVDNSGTIVDLVPYNRNHEEIAGLEYYSGVLIPGWVNAHSHLELSHLKGHIESGKGLADFIQEVQKNRKEDTQVIEKDMQQALRYMWSRGINGLGDVVNFPLGLREKGASHMTIHNFMELFNEKEKSIHDIIRGGNRLAKVLEEAQQQVSWAGHSMYGTNSDLWSAIVDADATKELTSLHFLESAWESQLPVENILNYLKKAEAYQRILLVHNVYLTQAIFTQIKKQHHLYKKLFWVLCPNSNNFIKSKLPAIADFYQWGMKLCLGTDSLASNHQLSILDEMKTITREFPEIPFAALLQWATQNGAEALGMQSRLGSFEKGKAPGVLLLSGFDFKTKRLSEDAAVTRLI